MPIGVGMASTGASGFGAVGGAWADAVRTNANIPADKAKSKPTQRRVCITRLMARVGFVESKRTRQVGQVGGATLLVDLSRAGMGWKAKSCPCGSKNNSRA
jgi:hypothetical protein